MGDAWDKAVLPIAVVSSVGVLLFLLGAVARALGGGASLTGEVAEYLGLTLMIGGAAAIVAVILWPSREGS